MFSVGGGLAIMPFLFELAGRYDWFTQEELAEIISVSEALPGPLGVNMTAFVGYTTIGAVGVPIAVVSLVTPSVIFVTVVSKTMTRYRDNRIVGDVFTFLRPMSVGLIAGAVTPLVLMAVTVNASVNVTAAGLLALMIVAVFVGDRYKAHPLIFIAAGAVLGVLFGGF